MFHQLNKSHGFITSPKMKGKRFNPSSSLLTAPQYSAYLQVTALQSAHSLGCLNALHADINDAVSVLYILFHDHIYHHRPMDDQCLNHAHEFDGYDLKVAMHKLRLHA